MKKRSMLIAAVALACVACEKNDHPGAAKNSPAHTDTSGRPAHTDTSGRSVREGQPAEMGGSDMRTSEGANRSMRDRSDGNIGPVSTDQAENDNDLTVTQNIRRAIVRDNNLSTTAKNIKIITRNGIITLRGPVDNSKEIDVILKIVNANKGNARVENFLEAKSGGKQ